MSAYDAAIAYATAEGTRDGTAAAGWVELPDGSPGALRAILDGIADGDPAVLDTLPSPDLSGQWADSLTGPMLTADALTAAGLVHPGDTVSRPYGHAPGACETCDAWDAPGDIADAYETAYSEAVESEVSRRVRYQLGEDA